MGMGKQQDYYAILNVTASAGEDELRRAYKKLAMRWHPDKHPSSENKRAVEAKFKQICQAYSILSDAQKRQIYDLYGEEGLKYDVSSPSAAAATARTMRKGASFPRARAPGDDIFGEFFGERSPGSDKGKMMKAEAVENKLACTLEELYKGSKRKMMISRIVPDDSGKPKTVEEVLSIDIRPGWKKGTKITFPEKGNQEPGLLPGDLIFIIEEKPHSTFKRDGNDLITHQKMSLLDALTGKTLNLTTLDGRNIAVEVNDIVKPGHEVVVPDEGMPISRDPKKKGNLRIKFDIKFPSRLSSDQKADLRRVLGRSS